MGRTQLDIPRPRRSMRAERTSVLRAAPSNAGPADPATDTPSARVPTAPEDIYTADREEGGADGVSSGESEIFVAPEEMTAPFALSIGRSATFAVGQRHQEKP